MNIQNILNGIKGDDVVFHSEAEFQFELAYQIRENFNAEVWVEYSAIELKNYHDYIGVGKNKIPSIDLVIKFENRLYPIELKYITSELNWNDYHLKDGNGTDKAFFYATDIHRIEAFRDKYPEKFEKGYAIIISNNKQWQKPICDLKDNTFMYSSFYLEDSINHMLPLKVQYKLKKNSTKRSDLLKKFVLQKTYPTKWESFSKIYDNGLEVSEFKYIITTIEK